MLPHRTPQSPHAQATRPPPPERSSPESRLPIADPLRFALRFVLLFVGVRPRRSDSRCRPTLVCWSRFSPTPRDTVGVRWCVMRACVFDDSFSRCGKLWWGERGASRVKTGAKRERAHRQRRQVKRRARHGERKVWNTATDSGTCHVLEKRAASTGPAAAQPHGRHCQSPILFTRLRVQLFLPKTRRSSKFGDYKRDAHCSARSSLSLAVLGCSRFPAHSRTDGARRASRSGSQDPGHHP